MGTRSLTVFIDNHSDKEIVVMYKQYDGYPGGYGKDLADFLKGKKIVNGYSDSNEPVFNGVSCLAASVVAEFKEGIGNIYRYPAGSRDCGEEYTYFVSGKIGEEANIKVIGYSDECLFSGKASKYDDWYLSLATE